MPGHVNVAEQWQYTIWDHADSSPVYISGQNKPAVIGGIWCSEAFGGTPDPLIQDGSTVLWTVDTASAAGDSILPMIGTLCATDLRVTSTTAAPGGAAGSFSIIDPVAFINGELKL